MLRSDPVTSEFDKLYYPNAPAIPWLGRPMLKYPADLCTLMILIQHFRPDFIIETGTWHGASAHFMACLCDIQQHGQVITIDIAPKEVMPHARLTSIVADSTDSNTVVIVSSLLDGAKNNLVVLDSDHHMDTVLRELELYSPFVPVGGYVVVEDTNVNGHPVDPDYGPGPMEAVEQFIASHPGQWIADDVAFQLFMHTSNPNGYLRRTASYANG